MGFRSHLLPRGLPRAWQGIGTQHTFGERMAWPALSSLGCSRGQGRWGPEILPRHSQAPNLSVAPSPLPAKPRGQPCDRPSSQQWTQVPAPAGLSECPCHTAARGALHPSGIMSQICSKPPVAPVSFRVKRHPSPDLNGPVWSGQLLASRSPPPRCRHMGLPRAVPASGSGASVSPLGALPGHLVLIPWDTFCVCHCLHCCWSGPCQPGLQAGPQRGRTEGVGREGAHVPAVPAEGSGEGAPGRLGSRSPT